eukprot:scaffold309_cov235-Pinguiococcus_pyrenoidosus.AAC.6
MRPTVSLQVDQQRRESFANGRRLTKIRGNVVGAEGAGAEHLVGSVACRHADGDLLPLQHRCRLHAFLRKRQLDHQRLPVTIQQREALPTLHQLLCGRAPGLRHEDLQAKLVDAKLKPGDLGDTSSTCLAELAYLMQPCYRRLVARQSSSLKDQGVGGDAVEQPTGQPSPNGCCVCRVQKVLRSPQRPARALQQQEGQHCKGPHVEKDALTLKPVAPR